MPGAGRRRALTGDNLPLTPDVVVTVCASAAGETCPVWPGRPMTAHWGIVDPGAIEGPDEQMRKAFFDAYVYLDRRISQFVSLPLAKLDRLSLQATLREIGDLCRKGE